MAKTVESPSPAASETSERSSSPRIFDHYRKIMEEIWRKTPSSSGMKNFDLYGAAKLGLAAGGISWKEAQNIFDDSSNDLDGFTLSEWASLAKPRKAFDRSASHIFRQAEKKYFAVLEEKKNQGDTLNYIWHVAYASHFTDRNIPLLRRSLPQLSEYVTTSLTEEKTLHKSLRTIAEMVSFVGHSAHPAILSPITDILLTHVYNQHALSPETATCALRLIGSLPMTKEERLTRARDLYHRKIASRNHTDEVKEQFMDLALQNGDITLAENLFWQIDHATITTIQPTGFIRWATQTNHPEYIDAFKNKLLAHRDYQKLFETDKNHWNTAWYIAATGSDPTPYLHLPEILQYVRDIDNPEMMLEALVWRAPHIEKNSLVIGFIRANLKQSVASYKEGNMKNIINQKSLFKNILLYQAVMKK